MPIVEFTPGCPVRQFERFPENVGDGEQKRPFKRSCVGALHIRPGTKTITQDELECLQKDKEFKGFVRVLAKDENAPTERPSRKMPQSNSDTAATSTASDEAPAVATRGKSSRAQSPSAETK